MLEIFTGLLNQKPALKILVGFILALSLYLIITSSVSYFKSKSTERNKSRIEKGANTALHKAAEQSHIADNSQIDRTAEDQVREQTIAPEVTSRRKSAQETQSRLNDAQINYENAQNPHPSYPTDNNALQQRNCADLKALYPNKRFADCP